MEPQEKAENKTRLYIAISMRGKSRDEILSDMRLIASGQGYNPDDCEFINLLSPDIAENHTPVECLGLFITQLAHADRVIIGKPGSNRGGVSCEEYICNAYHIPYTKVGFGDWE